MRRLFVLFLSFLGAWGGWIFFCARRAKLRAGKKPEEKNPPHPQPAENQELS